MKRLIHCGVTAVFAGMMALTGMSAGAQDSGEMTSLLVSTLYCESDTGYAGGDCEPASGVSVTVEQAGGDVLGTCVTEVATVQDSTTGYCYVEVPFGTEVVATLDESTLAAGYAPTQNPVQVSVRAEGDWPPDYIPVASFLNVPVAAEPEPDPDEGEESPAVPAPSLPRTGSGPISDQSSFDVLLAASGALGVIGVMLRRAILDQR